MRVEEARRIVDGHVQHIRDRLALAEDLERLAAVAPALAGLAGHEHVGQEVHLDAPHALARADLAATALHVEAEAAGLVATDLRLGHAGVDRPDLVEDPGVGRGVRARGAPDGGLVDLDHAHDLAQAGHRVVRAGQVARAGHVPLGGLEQDLVHERALAAAAHAGHADDPAERERDVDPLEVVLACALHDDGLLRRQRPPLGGDLDAHATAQVVAGQAAGRVADLRDAALRHDGAAVPPGPGPDVEHVVRRADHVLVVLDDEHRVADVAQAAQRRDEPVVVALVQADRGFIEHVRHAHEAAADLRGQTDALCLAAGERAARAVEREVPQADAFEEAQASGDLLDDRRRDRCLRWPQLEAAEEPARRADAQVGGAGDVEPAIRARHHHAERRRLEPSTRARRARRGAHVRVQAFLHELAVGLREAPAQVGEHALPAVVLAVHQRAARLRGELGERRRWIHALVGAPHADAARVPDVHAAPVLAERFDRLRHGLRLVGDHQVLVELVDRAQARARLARALRRVEAEDARLELLERTLGVVGAGKVLAEAVFGPAAGTVVHQQQQVAAAGLERRFDALRQALAILDARHDAVDDGIDRVGFVATEAERVLAAALLRIAEFDDGAVHACTHQAGAHHLLEDLLVEALARAHERGADHESLPRTGREHRLDDLRRCRRGDRVAAHVSRLVAVPAGGRTASGPQKAEVVVDLGRGGDRRAGAVPAGALLDRDRRRQTVDRLDVGLLHLVEELARVRAQALHVLALALGKDRVEREAALAAAGDAGDDHEPVAGDVDRERAEVVLPGAADADAVVGVVGGHGTGIIGS